MSVTEDTLTREFPIGTAWPGTVSWVIGLLVILALGLVPVYKFASGGFQLADPFIVVLIVMAFFIKDVNEHIKKHVYLLVPFIAWTIIVNGGYYLIYHIPASIRLMITSVYDFFILWCFTIILYEVLKKKGLIYIYLGLLLGVVAIFAVPGLQEWEAVRFSYSFNNPNQLALYCLILYSSILLLMQYRIDHEIKNKIYIVFDVIILIAIQYLSWQAISRAGMVASLFLHIALIRKIFSWRMFVPVSLAVSIPILYILFFDPSFIQERIAARDPAKLATEAVQVRIRTAIIRPMENLTGIKILVGTGSVDVKDKKHPVVISPGEYRMEVHSMFGHALWVYGIIGLLLYAAWIFKSIWETRILKDGLFVWAAILAYSVGGVIIRFRSFWILVGLMLALVGLKLMEKQSSNEYNT